MINCTWQTIPVWVWHLADSLHLNTRKGTLETGGPYSSICVSMQVLLNTDTRKGTLETGGPYSSICVSLHPPPPGSLYCRQQFNTTEQQHNDYNNSKLNPYNYIVMICGMMQINRCNATVNIHDIGCQIRRVYRPRAKTPQMLATTERSRLE